MPEPARSCINYCAPRWDFASTETQRCAVDPCNDALFDDPSLDGTLRVCPANSYCRPDLIVFGDPPTPFGSCVQRDGLLADCSRPSIDDPEVRDSCGAGHFCADPLSTRVLAAFNYDVERIPVSELFNPNRGICFFSVVEGQACDSNLTDRNVSVGGFPAQLGDAPCEIGTVCVDDPTTPAVDARCVRPCTDAAGNPDNTVCDCDDAFCRTLPSDVINEVTGENLGHNFCRPCLRSNRAGCMFPDDCCDRGAGVDCHDPIGALPDPPEMNAFRVCCRSEGNECDPSARIPQCCEDATCEAASDGSGTCTPCGLDGESPGPNNSCCPGNFLVGAGSPDAVCRRCARSELVVDTRGGVETVAYCGDEVFEVHSSSERVDGVFVPSSTVRYPYFFGGTVAGVLANTAGDAATARFDLGPEYRAYLLDGNMFEGISTGASYVELPQDDVPTGGPISIETNFAEADSFLLQDLGACSARVSWGVFAGVISSGVHQEVADYATGASAVLQGVTARGMTVRPVLRAAGGITYGLARDESYVQIRTEYDVNSLRGVCGPNRVTITANVLPDLTPGFVVTPESVADDAIAGTVGCEPIDATDTTYDCTVPVLVDGVLSTESRSFPRLPPNFYQMDRLGDLPVNHQLAVRDARFALLSCRAVRDRIECTDVPSIFDDTICHPDGDNCVCTECEPFCGISPFGADVLCFPPSSGGMGTPTDDPYEPILTFGPRTFPRRVRFVPGARDVELTVQSVEVDLSPDLCVLEEIITGGLERIIANELRGRISDEVTRALQLVLGSRATRDFGVPDGDVPACVTDFDCHAVSSPLFGGERHRCVDHDGVAGTGPRCDLIQLEMRRLYVSPRGIDLVIADGSDDPQFTPISGRTYGSSSLRPDDLVSCAPDRLLREPALLLSGGEPTNDTPIVAGESNSILFDNGDSFCSGTETGDAAAQCVCNETGTSCGWVPGIVAAGFSVPRGDLTCTMGRCCIPDGAWTPPEAAVTACASLAVGNPCSYLSVLSVTTINGVCQPQPGVGLACSFAGTDPCASRRLP